MKNKLEPLLNILIQRGRKPYWIEKDDIEVFEYNKDRKNISIWYMNWVSPSEWDYDWLFMSLRELVSKESWLWQFVCENEMIKGFDTSEYYINYRRFNKENFTECRYLREYQYRVIESSLKDESDLEDFLLSNIVIKDEKSWTN